MATDLAEFLGAALGFSLLFGIPLWIGVHSHRHRHVAHPQPGALRLPAAGGSDHGPGRRHRRELRRGDGPCRARPWGRCSCTPSCPSSAGSESVLLAVGIIGATVMPHVIFLHSSLTQSRVVVRETGRSSAACSASRSPTWPSPWDWPGIINMAMLIMASQTFHVHGMTNIGTIEDAHKTLQPLLGKAASWVFAISLLASGLSSSSVGTMAGQVIMQGFIRRQIPAWIRRLVTMVPSAARHHPGHRPYPCARAEPGRSSASPCPSPSSR